MPESEAELLLQKYKEGRCSPDEKKLIEDWFFNAGLNLPAPSENDLNRIKIEMWAEVQKRRMQKAGHFRLWPRIAIAATVLLLLVFSFSFYKWHREAQQESPIAMADKIQPAGKKAILTLGNGTSIVLDDLKNGEMINQQGIKITKTKEGQIVYEVLNRKQKTRGDQFATSAFNTIATPRGGQYQVILPDGTRVWLNAASCLTYPAVFNSDARIVRLTGEAYFEVAKIFRPGRKDSGRERLPFIVESAGQKVEVLGTHFNINAYQDEAAVKTTLLEGSVKVLQSSTKNSLLLRPGQQAVNNGNSLQSEPADAGAAIAWKNGLFSFENADLKTVMREIARWYDFDVEYQGTIPRKEFSGEIHNNVKASQVLEILKYFQAKYVVEETPGGRKILIKGIN